MDVHTEMLVLQPRPPLTGVSRALRARNPESLKRVFRGLPAPVQKVSETVFRSLKTVYLETPETVSRLFRTLFGPGAGRPGRLF